MLKDLYTTVASLGSNPVPKLVTTAAVFCAGSGMIASETRCQSSLVDHVKSDSKLTKIYSWARTYSLTASDLERLTSVLSDFDPDQQDGELSYELNSIIAERKLEALGPLTFEEIERAEKAFSSGKIKFEYQEV